MARVGGQTGRTREWVGGDGKGGKDEWKGAEAHLAALRKKKKEAKAKAKAEAAAKAKGEL